MFKSLSLFPVIFFNNCSSIAQSPHAVLSIILLRTLFVLVLHVVLNHYAWNIYTPTIVVNFCHTYFWIMTFFLLVLLFIAIIEQLYYLRYCTRDSKLKLSFVYSTVTFLTWNKMTPKEMIISFLIKDTQYVRILNFEFLMNFIKCETRMTRFVDYNNDVCRL